VVRLNRPLPNPHTIEEANIEIQNDRNYLSSAYARVPGFADSHSIGASADFHRIAQVYGRRITAQRRWGIARGGLGARCGRQPLRHHPVWRDGLSYLYCTPSILSVRLRRGFQSGGKRRGDLAASFRCVLRWVQRWKASRSKFVAGLGWQHLRHHPLRRSFGWGAVFKLYPSGLEIVLHSFTNGADGGQPFGNVIRDAEGNLYGTTPAGGAFKNGTVFKLDTTGKETVRHSFTGGADGGQPFAGLIRDAAGNLYGTTAGGGAFGNGTVFKLDTTGKETVLHSFTGGAGGSSPIAGLIRDSAGNLYARQRNGVQAGYDR
jgi:uncharacterized repeat protein (TIGR03803 family)